MIRNSKGQFVKLPIIKKICPTCKKEFILNLHIDRRAKGFCSKKCDRNVGQFKKGIPNRLGAKQSVETRQKLSKIIKSRILEGKHNFTEGHQFGFKKGNISWNKNKDFGGTELLAKRISWLSIYREWKKAVKERDKYKCIECGNNNSLNIDHYPISLRELIAKHNINFPQEAKKYSKFWDINNGRTLCVSCHKLTKTYGRNFVQKM